MTFRPIDGSEVPDEEIKKLEEAQKEKKEPEQLDSKVAKTPSEEVPLQRTEGTDFHNDPAVQLYIERQVQKRVGEGNQAYDERLGKLESLLTKLQQGETQWKPQTTDQEKAVRAIIFQAKREMIDELGKIDQEQKAQTVKEDEALDSWLEELKVTGKTDEEIKEITRLLAEYGKGQNDEEDKQLVLNLFNRLNEAKALGSEEGKTEEEKKKQEAKVGSSRTTGEPGEKGKSYQERKTTEPNFSAILERELSRLEQ